MNNLGILKIFKKRSVRYAIPFVIFMVGGAFGLKEFTGLRYEYRASNRQDFLDSHKELEKQGIATKKIGEVTLESEYEKIKDMDVDNWENKRVWRPWEDEELMKKQ